ncbi:MAG: TetR/AcrR family transcriptional regulator [Eubacteriales bacterium]|uniref:TetR/AcrR family transcriptional regulator n=1 Tax=Baileyella intestinalis TaxID=2606709 RepID=UPI0023EFAF79|nr:TetR/AcrR family transcriptional regulator [Baileyella intestinalis]MCI7685651.1 TetR/AcrR family transcriptional regulator [Clostridiales bacterium]MDD5875233.1 TetR/AcrR family transcriptional regulator [Baileyella intestinalis]MDY2995590.1 TetR/AcrR family transcriptional regulator [Baileyella intestinalis]
MRSTRNTAKEKIIDAAWELFQEVGYENATVNDIIKKSGTSRGAFYHHFRAKEDLLFQMAWYFDQGYEGWLENQPEDQNPITTLYKFLIFTLESVENSKYKDFLSQLYGYEVMTDGNRPIIDEQRLYFKTLLSLCADARNKKLISEEWSEYTLARTLAGLGRGLTYNWLLEKCRYSLTRTAERVFRSLLKSIATIDVDLT